MTFGFLEAATRTQIPESVLIVPGARAGVQILSGSRIRRFLTHFYVSKHGEDDKEGQLEHGLQIMQLVERALRALDEETQGVASIIMNSGIVLARRMYSCQTGALAPGRHYNFMPVQTSVFSSSYGDDAF